MVMFFYDRFSGCFFIVLIGVIFVTLVWFYVVAFVSILFPTFSYPSFLSSSKSTTRDINPLYISPSSLFLRHRYPSIHTNTSHSSATITTDSSSTRTTTTTRTSTFPSSLEQKRILFEITTVGMKQFAYLEHVLDSIRDLCEAGAHVSLHIITTNCPPPSSLKDNNTSILSSDCGLRGQSSNDTLYDNYPIYIIDQLNERLPRQCRNTHGSIESFIHVKSSDWGKQVVDFHRTLFYQHVVLVDEQDHHPPYDLFIHTEEDILIRPVNILAFLQEMYLLELKVGKEVQSKSSLHFSYYFLLIDLFVSTHTHTIIMIHSHLFSLYTYI